jgi:hypothetical protein
LIVITGPIAHVGWASACSGGDAGAARSASAAERARRCGQHEAAYLLGGAAAQALGQRGVLGVDRHDLAGLARARDERAADDQRLLVGQGEVLPASSAASVGAARRPR